jgi:phosphatidylserine/phosphatidylglycerophosphate/cardiolipin synthase-like enzyme
VAKKEVAGIAAPSIKKMPTTRQYPKDKLILAVEERRGAILQIIRNARRTLALSLFRCNDQAIFDELAAAVDRGVAVDVITTLREKGGRHRLEKLWESLSETRATVRTFQDPVVKYHAKYIVADDGPAVVASLNFTRKCFRKTCDGIVITYDPAVVADLQRLMRADAAGEKIPQALSERLVIGPERARRQYTKLIEEAKSSIRIIDAKLSDPDLVTLLRSRRAGGLTVEVFDSRRLGDLKSHGKIMAIDDTKVVVGSLSLAALSLDFRREVAIIVDEPAPVAQTVEMFRVLRDAAAQAGTLPAGAVDGAQL